MYTDDRTRFRISVHLVVIIVVMCEFRLLW